MLKLTCTLRSLLTKSRGVSPVILPGCYQPLTCAAVTPTQANSRIKGSGSREVSGQTSYSHTPPKNPLPIPWMQAYIAYLMVGGFFEVRGVRNSRMLRRSLYTLILDLVLHL
jgi:hypothetical protein